LDDLFYTLIIHMYSKIQNPQTGRMVSIHGVLGKAILRNYIGVLLGGGLVGGASVTNTPSEIIFVVAEWCGHCVSASGTFSEARDLIRTQRDEAVDAAQPSVFCLENSRESTWSLEPDIKGQAFKEACVAGCENAMAGFPTIIKRSGDQYELYDGAREAQAIADWAKLDIGPAIQS